MSNLTHTMFRRHTFVVLTTTVAIVALSIATALFVAWFVGVSVSKDLIVALFIVGFVSLPLRFLAQIFFKSAYKKYKRAAQGQKRSLLEW